MTSRTNDENLIIVSTAEEYAFLHKLKLADVLILFKKYKIESMLRSQYEVLHMLDIKDSVSFVESVLKRSVA